MSGTLWLTESLTQGAVKSIFFTQSVLICWLLTGEFEARHQVQGKETEFKETVHSKKVTSKGKYKKQLWKMIYTQNKKKKILQMKKKEKFERTQDFFFLSLASQGFVELCCCYEAPFCVLQGNF